ncbi:MAG: hypothetical protein VXY77_01955 [Pseudomonadota bacterium]|nr:hypothetical protein [Pseudomonadota bacterium]
MVGAHLPSLNPNLTALVKAATDKAGATSHTEIKMLDKQIHAFQEALNEIQHKELLDKIEEAQKSQKKTSQLATKAFDILHGKKTKSEKLEALKTEIQEDMKKGLKTEEHQDKLGKHREKLNTILGETPPEVPHT